MANEPTIEDICADDIEEFTGGHELQRLIQYR